MSFASYTRIIECITMEKPCNGQELDPPDVFEVIGEPAIVINGVPNVTPGSTATILDNTSKPEVDDDPCFGDWVVGRKIQKLFGDQYYSGKVEKFDTETNWYRVVYEDGDFEDLEWHELEDLLVPLDISIPLTILALHRCKPEKSVPESHIKLAKGRKNPRNSLGSKEMKPKLLQTIQVGESRDGNPMEANFSCMTQKISKTQDAPETENPEISKTQDAPETENPETYLSLYKHDESLPKPGDYTSSKICNGQESDSTTPVFEVIDEPAILSNGLPDATPGYTTTVQDTANDPEPAEGPCFGELFEGRNVQKLFGDRYYSGKVEKYDKETKWYRVVYEDGDFEDVEWHELEEVLLPFDVSIPFTTVASHGCKSEKSVHKSRINLAKERKNHKLAIRRKNHRNSLGSKGKTLEQPQIAQVEEPREANLKEANFSERTLQETLQMQNGLQRENEETQFLMCNQDESLFKLRDSITTSNTCDDKESHSTLVFKVIGEPAIVINGVPDATPGYTTTIQGTVNNPEPGGGTCFGEWLEGRKVQKLFRDHYYSGKVEKYNKKTKHYRVVYEDGNFEYLAARDLDNLLVPLDISIPPATLASHLCMSGNSVPKPRKERKNHKKSSRSLDMTTELLNISQAWETRDGKLVEADVSKRAHRGNSQMQEGLQIDSIEPCLQITKQVESVSRPGEGSTIPENNQNGESMDKMSNILQTPYRADINGDGLVLADAHREASGKKSSRWQRDFQKQSGKTARAEKQRRREKSVVQHSAYHPK